MAGNTFGEIFRVTTFGESHGSGLGAVIDGCPSRIPLAPEDFERAMYRRRPKSLAYDTPRKESDKVEIMSVVEHFNPCETVVRRDHIVSHGIQEFIQEAENVFIVVNG